MLAFPDDLIEIRQLLFDILLVHLIDFFLKSINFLLYHFFDLVETELDLFQYHIVLQVYFHVCLFS